MTRDVKLGALSCAEQRRCLVLLVAEQQDEHVHGSFSNVSVVQKAQSLEWCDENDRCFYNLLFLLKKTCIENVAVGCGCNDMEIFCLGILSPTAIDNG